MHRSCTYSLLSLLFVSVLLHPRPVEAGIYDADAEVTYKEYWVSHSEFTGGCGSHEGPAGGSWYLEPWPCSKTLAFEIPDDFRSGAPVQDSDSTIEWIHLSSANGDLPAPSGATQQTASLILDVDQDGKDDFVIGTRQAVPAMVWYQRNADGWTKYLIDDAYIDIEVGGAFSDIDGDGDLDVVMGGDYLRNRVWWWENPYPNYDPNTPWTRREIKNSGSNKHHDQIFGDFDGDGQAELVFWNQGGQMLFIADIPSDPQNTQPWPYEEVFSWSSGDYEGLAQADINGDGKADIVGGGRWFEHSGGTNYTPHIIDGSPTFARAAAGQLIAGGRPEVVFVPGDGTGRLKWYEWTDSGWEGHDLLGFDVDHGHSLEVADVDGDGHLDVFCAEMRLNGGNADAKMWVFLGDGDGNFTPTEVATGYGNHESRVGDLDGDGDLDILGKPYNWDTPRVDVWLNGGTGLSLDRWQRHIVDADKPWQAVFITSGDVDGDEQPDIVTGGWWYRNPGSPSGTWTRHTIGSPLNNMAAVYDFDGDGDVDVLGTQGQGAESNPSFVWGRNDGLGTFTILSNVESGDGNFLQGAAVARFQGDDLKVALSWHAADKGVQRLTVPADPSSEMWIRDQMSPTSQDEGLSAGDVDGDGDPDLLLGTKWLRNEGASWSPFTLNDTSGEPDRNRLADIDGDGRLDAVVGFEAVSALGKLAWYEQGSSATATWTEHVIANVVGPMSLDVADVDRDGDWDVVVGEHNVSNPSSAKLYVFENDDGQGSGWTEHVVYTGDEHHDGAQVVDIDGDGDLDIISIGWSHGQVLLYENKAIDGAPPVNQAPAARFSTAPTSGQSPLTVDFDATASNDPDGMIVAYDWDLGDGSSGTGATLSHEYTLIGTHLVTLTVTDDGGATDTATSTITISGGINIWHGSNQRFGHIGTPQQWVNVLGNVSDPDGIASLVYSLNGSPSVPLSVGPDGRRLALEGDFNIDIDRTDPVNGSNQVVITATDNLGYTTVETVTVQYTDAITWPQPYTIDWSTVTDIQDVAQVVDGKWAVEMDSVRPVEVGYDRLVAIGDLSWTDYEVTVPITIHDVDIEGSGGLGGDPGLGLLMRWTGHTDSPISGWQPKAGWEPYGAIGWWRWTSPISATLQFHETGISKSFVPTLGVPYLFKMSVESTPGQGGFYRLKVWEDGQPEPSTWNLSYQADSSDLADGSFMLLAHHVDASFGDVTVTPAPFPDTTPPVISDIHVTPSETSATVTWTTDEPATSTVSYGQSAAYEGGSVGDNALVTDHTILLTGLVSDTLYHYQVTSADGSGNVASSIDSTFTTTAASTPDPSGIVSDDFNTCSLDMDLWTVVNPRDDVTPTMTGTFTLDAWLSIAVPSGTGHDIWQYGNFAPRIMQPASDTDFEIEAKFESGVGQAYQLQGVLVEQDSDDFLRFGFYSDGSGTRLYAAIFGPGSSTPLDPDPQYNETITGTGVAPLYMRVRRQENEWTQSYSFDGASWTTPVTFTHAVTVTAVGTYVGNAGGSPPAHTGYIDYFFNTASPIVPEDGDRNTLTVNVVGTGSVPTDPVKSSYICGDVVTLTAMADPGWTFTGWSGDLSGSDEAVTVTMTGSRVITATFTQDEYTLRVNTVGSGRVTTEPVKSAYHYGDVVTLTAVADSGWTFAGWSGDLTGADSTATKTITGSATITATFTSYQLFLPFVVSSRLGDRPASGSHVKPDGGHSSALLVAHRAEAGSGDGDVVLVRAGSNSSGRFSGAASPLDPEDPRDGGNSAVDTTSPAVDEVQGIVARMDSEGPGIDVWYGHNQRFGHIGNPQNYVNVLGNVSDPDGVDSLVYSLNGGPELALSIGPDTRRLASAGDFNIDLLYTDLVDGTNQVVITATDSLAQQSVETVTVEYVSGNVWPDPYAIDWSTGTDIQDVAQVVDGKWAVEADSVRPVEIGYDRLVAIGDLSWTDYEVTVPITIHDVDMSTGPVSGSPGLGLLMRWTGHTDSPISGWQPKSGWVPLGTIGWWRWSSLTSATLQFYQTSVSQSFLPTLGVRYIFKMDVQSTPDQGGLYRLKVWEDGQPEPLAWNLTYQAGPSNLSHGSFMLLAHHVDASFGDVTVLPVGYTTSLTVTTVGSGTVAVEPNQPEYAYGQVITLTAMPEAGWTFSGWSGSLEGSTSPAVLTMKEDAVVTATFTQDAYTVTVHTVGSGRVITQPVKPVYHYGDVVTFTAVPATGWTFIAWSGDLTGAEATATRTITGNITVTATFIPDEYPLTVDTVGNGSVTADPHQAGYHYGDVVTLTATADPGWTFAGWSGDLSGSANPATITITGDASVTATFTQDEYTLTVNVVGNGRVTVDPDQVTYHYGDTVTLNAIADPEWTFIGWSGDLWGTDNPYAITITGTITTTATFAYRQIFLPLVTAQYPP